MLVGLGALSLVAAVAVFAAVSWSALAAWAQGALVVALTGVVLGAAVACRRRGLVATAESLGAVGVALGLADVQVGRVGLDGIVADRWVVAVGIAVVSAGLVAVGRWSGIRVPVLAGGALAFTPLVVAASGGRPLAAVAALALQAGIGGVVAARLGGSRSERPVALVGATVSWGAAVGGALALAGAGLAVDPVAHPVGPAAVLAGLALTSIVGARRLGTGRSVDVVGGAGLALALVPALLLASGSGSALLVLAVLAVEGVVALGWAGDRRASGGERVVAAAGGGIGWMAAATGLLALALGRLADGGPPTGPALVLAALAVASIVVARLRPRVAVIGGVGAAVAFLPGLLLAAGSGSVEVTLAVTATQAVVALAATGRLGTVEAGVARAGGVACWIVAASGTLLQVAVEIGAAPDVPGPRVGAVLVLAGLAVASIGVGRVIGRRALGAAGAGLAFLPVPLAVVGVVPPSVVVVALAAEAVVAAVLVSVVGRGPTRTVLAGGGVTAWVLAVAGATTVGLAGWLATPVRGPAGAVVLLVALAGVALGAARRGGWDRAATGAGLGAAVVPLLLAVALGAGGLGADGWVAVVLAAAALVATVSGVLDRVDEDRPWLVPTGVALVAGAALAVVPARTALALVAALLDRAMVAPGVGADVAVADWLRPALDTAGLAPPGWAAVAQLAGAAVLAGAVALVHGRVGRALGGLVALAALVVVPVAVGLTVGVTVVGSIAVVVALALVIRVRPRHPELLAGSAVTVLVGTAFALGSAPGTVAWTIVVGAAVGGLAVEAVVRQGPDAAAWVGAAVAVLLAGVGLDAWVLGASGPDGLLAVAVAASAVSAAAVLLERRGLVLAADVVDLMVAVTLGLAPLLAGAGTGSLATASPFLVLVGVTAAGAAVRPRRRSAWMVATASAVLLAWVEAGDAGIAVVEAYTLPLAAWALLVGRVAGDRDRTARPLGSWARYGIGLLTAAGPTTVLAVLDPRPVRTVAVVAVGSAVAVWGATARLQAPLAVGAGAVATLAVRHLGPVGVDLPRYVTFAVAGLVLLVVGATFEQRRQDLRHARDAFARLR
ncbi:MAG TPA: hypothetical protein VFU19_03675 [Iamia sp.]|nr:hypothetical protein [Iamia sp.]